MKRHLWMAFVSLLILGSCSQEEWQSQESVEDVKDLIVASLGVNDSRASILDKTLIWNEGDQIAVMGEDGMPAPFALLEEFAGSATGEFEGHMPEGPQGVVFPYLDNANISDGLLRMYLPAEIKDASGSCNLPMWSSWSNGHVYFKHLVGLLAISLKDIPEGYDCLVLSTSNAVCGEFTADISQKEIMLQAAPDNTNEENKTLRAKFTKGEDKQSIVYIPLPAGTYSNIKVSLAGAPELVLKNWTNKVVQRAKIYSASLTYVPVAESEPAKVSAALAEAFKVSDGEGEGGEGGTTEEVTAPEESTQVDLTEQIDATATTEDAAIVVPAAAENKTSDISLNFKEAPKTSEEKPLVIEQDANKTVGESNNTLTLNMPSDAVVENLEVKAPTTSTVLNGATYTRLFATTANNTLIIGNGTIIKDLVIGGGNIRIQKGAQITGSITNAANALIEIILEEGVELDETVQLISSENGSGFVVLSAAEIDLRQAIKKGGKVVLSQNVEIEQNAALSHIFTIENPVILDLNEKSLICEGNGSFIVNSSLTINDGANNTGYIKGAILASGGDVVINGGTFEGGLSIGSNGGSISVRGGIFKGFNPSEFVNSHYVVKEVEPSVYEVVIAGMEVDGDTYTINTAEGLRQFASMVNDEGNTFEGKTVKLGASIDLEYEKWTPIGMNETYFKGTFDGQGYSIKHLKIKETDADMRYVGFFTAVESAVIKNLILAGGEVSYVNEEATTNYNVGALVGRGLGLTMINCHNESCVVTVNSEGYFGGLVGYPTKSGSIFSSIIACSNSATVTSESTSAEAYVCLGGIAGGAWGAGTSYVACYNEGDILAHNGAEGTSSYIGGIVGVCSGTNYMYGCYAEATVEGAAYTGTLMGEGSYSAYVYSSGYAGTAPFIGNDIATNVTDVVNGSYNECVKTLNEGIQRYNWTATVPCEYTFVEGTLPEWKATNPNTQPGTGGNGFGHGGKF